MNQKLEQSSTVLHFNKVLLLITIIINYYNYKLLFLLLDYDDEKSIVAWKVVDYEFAGDIPYL